MLSSVPCTGCHFPNFNNCSFICWLTLRSFLVANIARYSVYCRCYACSTHTTCRRHCVLPLRGTISCQGYRSGRSISWFLVAAGPYGPLSCDRRSRSHADCPLGRTVPRMLSNFPMRQGSLIIDS